MSIVGTNKRQEGRSVYIKSNPVVGLLTLTSFTDDANGPVGSADFVKTFRYTTNGVQYSDWLPLTVPAIAAIQVDSIQPFVIEVAYFKDEPVGTSALDVNEITIGTTTTTLPLTPFFDNSLFKKYFNAFDQDVLNWYVNVLEKLWEKGLIPDYMTRDPLDPEDYLALWSAVCEFFAYYVTFARTFATFYNNYDILSDFLEQRGLTTSPEDTLSQLDTMLESFYKQMSWRGTNHIIDETDGSDQSLTGEFRRLSHYKTVDEFLFLLYRSENFGWCLGRSSPLYRGLRINDGLNKVPWSQGYTDMSGALPFITNGIVTSDGTNTVAQLTNGSFSATMKMDPNLDYEISFQIKLTDDGKLSLSTTGFDNNNNSLSMLSYKTGGAIGGFFTNAVLYRSDKYLTVKTYIYNRLRPVFADNTTDIRQGQDLKSPAALSKLQLTLSITGTAQIFDFKVLPMMTDYSRGFLQANNFISAWVKNRNNIYSTLQLEDYTLHYLLPYNSHLKIKNIGDYLYQDAETDPDQTFWVGSGEYCQKVIWVGTDPSCEIVATTWIPEEETAYCEQTP